MRIATILMVLVLTAAAAHAQHYGVKPYGIEPYQPPPVQMWTPPQRTIPTHTEFRQQMQREQDIYSIQEQQAEQQRQLERTIRCNRFGSREVYGDCFNW